MLRIFAIILTFVSLAWIILGTILILDAYETRIEFFSWVLVSISYASFFILDLFKIRSISQIYLRAFAKIFKHNLAAMVVFFIWITFINISYIADSETNLNSDEDALGLFALSFGYIYLLIYLNSALIAGFAFGIIKFVIRIRNDNTSHPTEI